MSTITSRCLRKLLLPPVQSSRVQGLRRSISANVSEQDQMLLIKENQQQANAMQFPGIWLRDNCTCKECFHSDSFSRKPLRWFNFDSKVKVQAVTVDESRQKINILWSDKHRSTFSLSWLRERDFSPESRERYLHEWYRPETMHWGKYDFEKILKTFDYWEVMCSDAVLMAWLEMLAIYGVALLKNSPLDIDVVKSLANRIGFIRKTAYGEVFSVRTQPVARNYAYLSAPLPLHTDMPYCEYKPGVTILHTLEQSHSNGGWNMLLDGFSIADQLFASQPDHFKTLSQTRVNWCDIGVDGDKAFYNMGRAPVIKSIKKNLFDCSLAITHRQCMGTHTLRLISSRSPITIIAEKTSLKFTYSPINCSSSTYFLAAFLQSPLTFNSLLIFLLCLFVYCYCSLDADGKYARINHSVPQRDSHFSVDVDKVVPWYEANAMFVRMAQKQAVALKTQPGDVLSFNNLRVLHGRTGYNDTELNVRHIAGCFVDWDIIYSKMRVLKRAASTGKEKEFGPEEVSL